MDFDLITEIYDLSNHETKCNLSITSQDARDYIGNKRLRQLRDESIIKVMNNTIREWVEADIKRDMQANNLHANLFKLSFFDFTNNKDRAAQVQQNNLSRLLKLELCTKDAREKFNTKITCPCGYNETIKRMIDGHHFRCDDHHKEYERDNKIIMWITHPFIKRQMYDEDSNIISIPKIKIRHYCEEREPICSPLF